MTVERFANTKIGRLVIRIIARLMESRLRYRFFGPERIVGGADLQPGMTVLELGCGTGFFTPTIARAIGERGTLIAMDVLPESVEAVSEKVRALGLENVRVIQGDALDTRLDDESIDAVLLFGVIPAPMVPLDRLLPEMGRVLKPGGVLAVWPASWMRRSIPRSGLFSFAGKRYGVIHFRRI